MKTTVFESLLNKYAGLKVCNFIKERLQYRCFPMKFTTFLRIPFFTEHIRWLLLQILRNSLFIAFENNEWCHFVVRIDSPAFISFYCVCFVCCCFFLFSLFFCGFYYFFGFEVSLSKLKTKQWSCS